jgi:hypothetical protein
MSMETNISIHAPDPKAPIDKGYNIVQCATELADLLLPRQSPSLTDSLELPHPQLSMHSKTLVTLSWSLLHVSSSSSSLGRFNVETALVSNVLDGNKCEYPKLLDGNS